MRRCSHTGLLDCPTEWAPPIAGLGPLDVSHGTLRAAHASWPARSPLASSLRVTRRRLPFCRHESFWLKCWLHAKQAQLHSAGDLVTPCSLCGLSPPPSPHRRPHIDSKTSGQ